MTQMNISMKQKHTHRHRTDLWLPRRMWGRGWESGVSRCKLLYTGWIKNKVLLYSTEDYIQYPVIDYGGGE